MKNSNKECHMDHRKAKNMNLEAKASQEFSKNLLTASSLTDEPMGTGLVGHLL